MQTKNKLITAIIILFTLLIIALIANTQFSVFSDVQRSNGAEYDLAKCQDGICHMNIIISNENQFFSEAIFEVSIQSTSILLGSTVNSCIAHKTGISDSMVCRQAGFQDYDDTKWCVRDQTLNCFKYESRTSEKISMVIDNIIIYEWNVGVENDGKTIDLSNIINDKCEEDILKKAMDQNYNYDCVIVINITSDNNAGTYRFTDYATSLVKDERIIFEQPTRLDFESSDGKVTYENTGSDEEVIIDEPLKENDTSSDESILVRFWKWIKGLFS